MSEKYGVVTEEIETSKPGGGDFTAYADRGTHDALPMVHRPSRRPANELRSGVRIAEPAPFER
jgi:hypothetical protein